MKSPQIEREMNGGRSLSFRTAASHPKNENLLNGVLAVAANKSGFSSQKIYVC